MSVEVRRFEHSDGEAVAELWRRTFPDDPPRNEPSAMIARKMARDPELFWVATARDSGAVVGAVMAGYDGVRGWLYHLAVAPERRREGVATALIDRAVRELHALGCRKINLQVRAANTDVIAMYAALGWEEDRSVSLGRVLPERLGG